MRLAAAALLLLALAAPVARAEPPGCSAPAEYLAAQPLPATARAAGRGELRVLVVGSASVAGPGTTGGASVAWPERLETTLAARLRPISVRLSAQGGRGMTAADHLKLLVEHAPQMRPHLVIWQVGTVEAARALPVEEMTERLQLGIAQLRVAGTDVILMDPQFSRFLRANADVETYRNAMRLAAAASGAQVFSRYGLMRAWAEADRLDLERAPRSKRTALTDELNDCIARALTEFILDGMHELRR